MIDDECRFFLEELSELEMMATNADHQGIQSFLQRWFYTIERAPDNILAIVGEIRATTSLQAVNENMVRIQNGIGNNQFVWPLSREERLGGQHFFLEAASNENFEFTDFLVRFYRVQHGDLNDSSDQFVTRFFSTYARELTRYLEMRLNGDPVPASDRIVAIDHNSKEFSAIEVGLEEVETALAASNSIKDKELIQAELAAGRKIIEAPLARVTWVRKLLVDPLVHISKIGRDTALSIVATTLIALILAYFGIII
jgi:hypothetical protein